MPQASTRSTSRCNLPTFGLGGTEVSVTIFGVDVLGNVGPTVLRRFTIE